VWSVVLARDPLSQSPMPTVQFDRRVWPVQLWPCRLYFFPSCASRPQQLHVDDLRQLLEARACLRALLALAVIAVDCVFAVHDLGCTQCLETFLERPLACVVGRGGGGEGMRERGRMAKFKQTRAIGVTWQTDHDIK